MLEYSTHRTGGALHGRDPMVDLLHRRFQLFCIGGPQRPFHDYTLALVQVLLGVPDEGVHRTLFVCKPILRAGLSLPHLLT